MIQSAAEFIRLRCSSDPEEYRRAAHEDAPDHVWQEVIDRHPEMRFWVAHNKTVPLWALKKLARDRDPRVRGMVAMKRKLPIEILKTMTDDVSATVAWTARRQIERRDSRGCGGA